MTTNVIESVFKRRQLFNVRDANLKNKGYRTKEWDQYFSEWEAEELVTFDKGYWLTDKGSTYLSAL